jgi:dTDP-4-amino-4,6-dideoxygalactose transaminase
MLNTEFSPWPSYTEEEATAIQKVLLSNKVNYWTGQECQLFEQEFATWCGVEHAIAVANGTLALELALQALEIGVGDEVIVPARTFLASADCVVTRGATPVFSDVELADQNISASQIEKCLTPKTKAVIVVHLGGVPVDMDPIMALSKKHNFYVIEDCAQAHGARYKEHSVGSIGHIGAWSFCQDKIMTTGGEGGMVTTNDSALWQKMWAYKDHGKSYETVYNKEHPPGFRWLHESIGSNFKMTEMQAAIGRIQLKKMSQWTAIRHKNAMQIISVANQFSCVRNIELSEDCKPAFYKQYIFINSEHLKQDWSRDRIIEEMNVQGIPCYSGSCSEVYLEKEFQKLNLAPEHRLPNAKQLGDTSLMFLVHPTLTKQESTKIAINLFLVLTEAQD